ncbi:MAG: histidine kinase [Candidatus Omnitrophica bacterium]|nr:histidine kinase [Candidatus Omnitrophota bacterium]MDD5670724.1 histidine kinase [Candidatus Omnitrophota bacterium]
MTSQKTCVLHDARSSRLSRILTLLVIVLPLLFAAPHFLLAQKTSKDEVLTRYQKIITQAEELQIYQDDVFKTIPKLRLATSALLKDNFEDANRYLNEAQSDLDLIRTKKPISIKRQIWFSWLETLFDVFQKFALIILLAFLLIKWPFFGRMIYNNHFLPFGKIYLAFFVSTAAIFLSLLDLARYGGSAWAFFDIQIVLIVAGGLLGGMTTGFIAGLCVGAVRLILGSSFVIYAAVAVAAGVLSGLMSRRIKSFYACRRIGFLTGLMVGFIHALVVYLPMINIMPWFQFLLTIGLIAVLEGCGVLVFLTVISFVVRERNRRQMERDLLKTRLLFLQAQMSPHFLFNALNTIAAICSRESATQAHNLVLRLAEFLRRTLRREDETVSLREEVAYVDSYLEIEKARFQERLRVEREIALADPQWEIKIPILILQPLVENAVRHGIGKKEQGGTVRIKIAATESLLAIEIIDDGVGMDANVVGKVLQDSKLHGEGLGLGLKNIHERLIRFYGEDFGLRFESEKGRGTKVTVRVPLQKEKSAL